MDIDLSESLVRLLPGVATLLSVIGGLLLRTRDLRADTLRTNLEKDAKILAALPENNAQRKLEAYIAERIDELRVADSGTRNWPTFVMAVITAPALGYLAIWVWGLGYLWAYPVALITGFLSAATFYGVFESLQKKDRSDVTTK